MSPVSLKVGELAKVVMISVKGPEALVARSTLKPVSLAELSVHDSVMLLADKAVAVRPEGAAGEVKEGTLVIAWATLVLAESPTLLVARTR